MTHTRSFFCSVVISQFRLLAYLLVPVFISLFVCYWLGHKRRKVQSAWVQSVGFIRRGSVAIGFRRLGFGSRGAVVGVESSGVQSSGFSRWGFNSRGSIVSGSVDGPRFFLYIIAMFHFR